MDGYYFMLLSTFLFGFEFCASLENVAGNKTASQNEALFWHEFAWTADKAVDGCIDRSNPEISRCCSCNQGTGLNNYWRVDLGDLYSVRNVTIVGRELSSGQTDNQLLDFQLYVIENPIDGNETEIYDSTGQAYGDGVFYITFDPEVQMRVLVVRRPDHSLLTLCEVEVLVESTSATTEQITSITAETTTTQLTTTTTETTTEPTTTSTETTTTTTEPTTASTEPTTQPTTPTITTTTTTATPQLTTTATTTTAETTTQLISTSIEPTTQPTAETTTQPTTTTTHTTTTDSAKTGPTTASVTTDAPTTTDSISVTTTAHSESNRIQPTIYQAIIFILCAFWEKLT